MVSTDVYAELKSLAAERILVLDGAMGALIQAYRTPSGDPPGEDFFRGEEFKDHPMPLKGCNDLLCLTQPDLISGIHRDYLKAGADIIGTCSFNATAVSLGDYGLGHLAYRISAAAARLAREAASSWSTPDKPRFVAGSMGPTSKSAGIPYDPEDPGKRAVSWDVLEAAYYDNARGLIDGGADLLIIETVFDTLNAKAAIFAVKRLEEERGARVPLIISATVSDGGRLLSGQSVEAFCVSVLHAGPLALGLNCSSGAEKLKPHLAAMSADVPCLVSAYPGAGFPDSKGVYSGSPETMADHIESYFRDGLVNIAGSCCGSTPAHTALIAERAARYAPRPLPPPRGNTRLAGLEVLEPGREQGITLAGERCNTAGSRAFRELTAEGDYKGAAGLARDEVEAGARIIDVSLDGTLPDPKAAVTGFLNLALACPDIARLPLMPGSDDWEITAAGLKCLPGKGLANSFSLKNGEAEFLRQARLVRNYGAAAVVRLIDGEGPAVSYERKIQVAARAWTLLTGSGFPPEDIVFDPVVLPAAADGSGYCSTALDFMRACRWIRDNCPGAQVLGGISNVSSGFRKNKAIREAMNAVFLKQAAGHGLSIAIASPGALTAYGKTSPGLREAVEEFLSGRITAEDFISRAVKGQGPAGKNGSPGDLLPLEEARKNKAVPDWGVFSGIPGAEKPLDLPELLEYPPGFESQGDTIILNGYPVERVIPYLDWTSLLQTWDLARNTYPSAFNRTDRTKAEKALEKLMGNAEKLLKKNAADGTLCLRGVVGFFPAYSEGDDTVIPGAARFIFPRSQERKPGGAPNPCLSDFILPRELYEKEGASAARNPAGRLGLFALSAGTGLHFQEARKGHKRRNGSYNGSLIAGLANALVEAFSREIHRRISRSWGGGGIRPVFGYPACPDHRDKEIAFSLLDAGNRCGLTLTGTGMIIPAASVCGMYLAHPDSYYFGAGMIGDDQLSYWAGRKGISPGEAGKRLAGGL